MISNLNLRSLMSATIIAATALVSLTSSVRSDAAEATMISFTAIRVTSPMQRDQLDFHYTAEWTTSGLWSFATREWFVNDAHNNTLDDTLDYDSPVEFSGTSYNPPQTEATGSYYKSRIKVRNAMTTYAESYMADGNLY